MNPFWQITMIEFLLNVAVFAGAIIFYGPMRILATHLSGDRKSIESSASGVLFGIATSVALLLPVHLEGGAAVGCSTILLALVGPLDGQRRGSPIKLRLSHYFSRRPWASCSSVR
jgi:hypothetical protein